MARRFTPEPGEITHITVRCNNKAYLLDPPTHHRAIIAWLNCLPFFYAVQIHHVMIMSNHLHLLLTPQHNNLGQAMSYCLTNLAKYLNYRLQRKNHVFGARYQPTIITDQKHLQNVIRYIYQNPVRAGMVEHAEDYPYSSLGCYLGDTSYGLRVYPDPHTAGRLACGTAGLAGWQAEMVAPLSEHETTHIAAALKRRQFKFTTKQIAALLRAKSGISL